MKAYEFTKIDTVKIDGHQVVVKGYTHGNYFQVGKVKFPAKSKDEAIEKYRAFVAKGVGSENESTS
jgi:hypothetical protein